MSVPIVSANTTFKILYNQLTPSTASFDRFWPSPGSFYNNIHGQEVNILKYIKFLTNGNNKTK